ncbi:hypothetical protein [Liberiplasma polymorphum]|uniref:hypothetical protein n=1 Tax=Liberiplasma polymorphum TaxID=3374570 RepID=UPI003771CED2
MKSKICLITTRNLFNISSLHKYLDISNDMDIIYWDQHSINELFEGKTAHKFAFNLTYNKSKIKKLQGYLKYRRYIIKVLKKEKYDKLIILPTQVGLLIYKYLLKHYRNKYILDIRDYSGERNKVKYYFISNLVKNSLQTVITSQAYRNFLPEHNYIISHNISSTKFEYPKKEDNPKPRSEKIIISCIGSIRFIEQFKKIINIFKNDNRFELRFIGRGSENLRLFVEKESIKNVKLIGRFVKEKTIDFYLETDIILNTYGNNNPYLDYALSNKLYYGVQLNIPLIVDKDTYMSEIVNKYNLGFVIDYEANRIPDFVYDSYIKIDFNDFKIRCNNFLEIVSNDEETFKSVITSCLINKED